MQGGIESGKSFHEPGPFENKLLIVKGKTHARIFRVDFSSDSLNLGDVFILESEGKIYVWFGPESNHAERGKAMAYAQSLRTFEHHCNSEVVNTNEHPDWEDEFWALLGGKPANIKAAVPDEAADSVATQYKFWEIKLAGNKVNLNEVTERPLREEMLKTENVYILELNTEVHIWIGREANLEEKKNALFIGKGFIQQHNKPKGTRVYRIVEKTEKAYFKSFFSGMFKTIKHDVNVAEETQQMIE